MFEEALAAANAVTDETKDEDVQKIADTLANAIKALKKAETPAPPVTEDSVITAPRLSYTAPVAGETAVVPSYVAMEDQSAKPATLEVKDDVVVMDFNHPLAGETLHFSGEVIDVHEPTAEEIAALSAPTGGCGCGCDDCGSDCGDHDHKDGGCGCGSCH